jgi:hypothetical protein
MSSPVQERAPPDAPEEHCSAPIEAITVDADTPGNDNVDVAEIKIKKEKRLTKAQLKNKRRAEKIYYYLEMSSRKKK